MPRDRELQKLRQREWYQRNKDRLREKTALQKAADPEAFRSQRNAIARAWAVKNPGYSTNLNAERRKQNRELIWKVKLESVCCKCGEGHPATLDFHHEDSSGKLGSVSDLLAGNRAIDVLRAEIAKCIVICSNCHRKLHYELRHPPVAQRTE